MSSRLDQQNKEMRKSHEQIRFVRMFSEEPKRKYQLTSYNERRNIKLRNKSLHKSEQ
jgi:hypothetical protein